MRDDSGGSRAETQVYRDQAYVYRQVTQLAAQLNAIEQPAPSDPPPPRGLDPSASRCA